jgi:hypothetical protein
VCPRCRDAVTGWARAASGAGNRWAAIAAAAAAAARRGVDGKHPWQTVPFYYRRKRRKVRHMRQAEEAEVIKAVRRDGTGGRGGNYGYGKR